MFRASLVALAVAAALILASSALGKRTIILRGTVGPSFTIKLTKGGKKVRSLKAGMYKFAISDRSNFHSFVVEKKKGGKFEKTLTTVSFVGRKTVKIRLTRGKWKFYCMPHESQMHGFFTVR